MSLTEYLRLNSLEILTYVSAGILIGCRIGNVLFDDKILNKLDYTEIGFCCAASLFSIISSGIKRANYDKVGETIKKYGLTQDILKNRGTKKLARIYCLENGLEREFDECKNNF
ncbi:MAG: hypothetical protein WC584_05470 [Candidatus Pacearchaeota archaeon]